MADNEREWEREGKALVEISEAKLQELLSKAHLEIGKDVRILKALEIQPGAVISKQYDR